MFYDHFLELCNKKGISPSKVALLNGISKTSVTRWKNGATPNGEILKKIADYFGVTTDFLLTGSDNKKSPGANPEDDYQFALLDGSKELTDEGKKELINYLEYLKNKYKK